MPWKLRAQSGVKLKKKREKEVVFLCQCHQRGQFLVLPRGNFFCGGVKCRCRVSFRCWESLSLFILKFIYQYIKYKEKKAVPWRIDCRSLINSSRSSWNWLSIRGYHIFFAVLCLCWYKIRSKDWLHYSGFNSCSRGRGATGYLTPMT